MRWYQTEEALNPMIFIFLRRTFGHRDTGIAPLHKGRGKQKESKINVSCTWQHNSLTLAFRGYSKQAEGFTEA